MKFSIFSSILLWQSTTALSVPSSLSWRSKTIPEQATTYDIPTVEESAAMARRILRLTGLGTLSTIYPNSHPNAGVAGAPVGMPDYFADCEPTTGNPTLLGMRISTSFRNAAAAGSNITLSMRWHSPGKIPRSAMEMPRFSLIGELEGIDYRDVLQGRIPLCYGKTHPDSVVWFPGNPIHESYWTRLVVKEIYWVGGFGNQAYIGFIPLKLWQAVTEKEIDEIRLPGDNEGKDSMFSRLLGAFEL